MEDYFQILFFILVFVVGPLLNALKQKNQQKKTPPPRPQQRPGQVPSRTEPADFRTPAPQRTEEEESAASMVPDDLWAVLTGQPSPGPRPQQRAPEPEWHEEDEDEELVELEVPQYEPQAEPWRPPRPAPVPRERESKREPTYVVSLETMPLPPRERHAAFHERLAARAEPEHAQPVRNRKIAGVNLRDAFVIQTVLGKPKSME